MLPEGKMFCWGGKLRHRLQSGVEMRYGSVLVFHATVRVCTSGDQDACICVAASLLASQPRSCARYSPSSFSSGVRFMGTGSPRPTPKDPTFHESHCVTICRSQLCVILSQILNATYHYYLLTGKIFSSLSK